MGKTTKNWDAHHPLVSEFLWKVCETYQSLFINFLPWSCRVFRVLILCGPVLVLLIILSSYPYACSSCCCCCSLYLGLQIRSKSYQFNKSAIAGWVKARSQFLARRNEVPSSMAVFLAIYSTMKYPIPKSILYKGLLLGESGVAKTNWRFLTKLRLLRASYFTDAVLLFSKYCTLKTSKYLFKKLNPRQNEYVLGWFLHVKKIILPFQK
jgi:hypothetical protein